MKILLINPPFQRLKGIAHIYFSLGLGYLCSTISRNSKVDAMIYNAEAPALSEKLPFYVNYDDMFRLHDRYIKSLADDNHYVWQEVRGVIKEFMPDLIGISVMTAKYGSALKISEIAKNINKGCRIIWGGPHATVDADRVLQNSCVDFVVRGEGEITLKKLVDLISSGDNNFADIRGLTYKDGDKIFHNPDAELIEDLDRFGCPEKDKVFFKERYLPSSWGDIVTLRGCPFKCGYCSAHNTWSYKVRYRNPVAIAQEIKDIIAKYNTREFYFWDDNFTLNRNRAFELCRLIKEIGAPIKWNCTTRVDLLDDELVKEMKSAGCDHLSIGIETGSERMLEKIQKGITLEKAYRAADLLDKHSIAYEAFFMIGFPEETEDDIRRTVACIKRLKNASICLSIFTPYPGTQQYHVARKLGLVPNSPEWSHFSHQSRTNHFMKYISKERFEEIVKEVTSLVDSVSLRNIGMARLFWNSCLNFRALVKRPGLFINKLKTLAIIISRKLKSAFKGAAYAKKH